MKNWTRGKRLTAALLTAALLLSILPSGVIPVHSEESEAQAVDYSQYIGYFAEIKVTEKMRRLVTANPRVSADEDYLVATDLAAPLVLQIVDYCQVGNSLWYKVAAAPGYTLPKKLETYPWVYQNQIGGAESDDALVLTKPTFSDAASSVVRDKNIAVTSDVAELTELEVGLTTIVPKESYIADAITYDICPKTATGSYSGYATVEIPIPRSWDDTKIFGFVIENDDTVSMISGTVTEFGTFRFTVPHFSLIGIAQVTDTAKVASRVITFGKIQEENTVAISQKIGTKGRYTTECGAVEYVIDHVTTTATDGTETTTTHITFKGLDVTGGVNIKIDDYSFVVKVNAGSAKVEKLLTAGTAASTTLLPLYDLGVTGPYTATYVITSGEAYITCNNGTITAVTNATGTATVVATVRHNTSMNVVATVTYTVTVSSIAVNDVKMLYVPQNGTVTITNYVGTVTTENLLDPTIATVETITDENDSVSGIKITGVANTGETYFIADTGSQKVLFVVYAEPENPDQSNQVKLWYIVNSNANCTVYYAVNGGTLHCLPAGTAVNSSNRVLLIGLDIDTHQGIPGKVSLIFFGAPDAGYATAKITASKTLNQFYCLSNGTLYDGSDSDAWPLDAAGNPVTDKFGKEHGLYAPIVNGNMDADGLRDLFARALALGCDSVFSFTKTGNVTYATDITFIAEKLPVFKKTITHYKRAGSDEWVAYNDDVILNVGDSVRYQFRVVIDGEHITYDFTITDPYITQSGGAFKVENQVVVGLQVGNMTIGETPKGNLEIGSTEIILATSTTTTTTEETQNTETADDTSTEDGSGEGSTAETVVNSTVVSNSPQHVSLEFKNITQSVSFTVDYTLNTADIDAYADGLFTNRATLGYTYDSDAASGENTAEAVDSAACKVNHIVTWKDCFGVVIAVKEVAENTTVEHPKPDTYNHYTFDGWYLDGEKLTGNTYTVSYAENEHSITFIAQYTTTRYQITYQLDADTYWPANVTPMASYTFGDVVDLQVPQKPGYVFVGWEVASTDGGETNWDPQIDCNGEYVIAERYGNVTLTPRWTYTTLTIKVEGWDAIDEGQTFLFTITDSNGLSLDVVVAGNGSVTIEGLNSETQYTITQKLDWSWRYQVYDSNAEDGIYYDGITCVQATPVAVTENSVTITLAYNAQNEVTFKQERVEDQWLDGNGDNLPPKNQN